MGGATDLEWFIPLLAFDLAFFMIKVFIHDLYLIVFVLPGLIWHLWIVRIHVFKKN